MQELFNERQRELREVVNQFPWEDSERYRDYLAQTYFYVRHSTRLLAAAACRFPVQMEELHHRYLKHAREENAHDVLALRDLSAMGGHLDHYPEKSWTQMLYQPQYYQVSFVDPTCLFGYIFALEGVAHISGEEVYERLQKTYGGKGTSFLKLHSKEDHDHIEKAFKGIAGLDEARQELIRENFNLSMDSLTQFFVELAKQAPRSLQKTA